METFITFVFVICLVVIVSNTIYGHIYKVVSMPSTPWTRRAIINHMRDQGMKDGAMIYELGSGLGGLCFRLKRAFPKAEVVGYEISFFPYWISRISNVFYGCKLHRKDIFKEDLSKADILVCYLSPYHMDKLREKLEKEMKRPYTLYSQGFPVNAWAEDTVLCPRIALEGKIYVYKRF